MIDKIYYRIEKPRHNLHLAVGSDEALIGFLSAYFRNSHNYQLIHVPEKAIPQTEAFKYFKNKKKHWNRMSSFLL